MSVAEREFVEKCKLLARNPCNHADIINEVTFLQMLACILDRPDLSLVKSALQTIELLARNKANHCALKSASGVMDTITLISKKYSGVAGDVVQLCTDILNILESPAYCTRSSKRQEKNGQNYASKLRTKVITLLVHGLCEDKQEDLQAALVRLKYVVSFSVDVIHQRCVVRVLDYATPKMIVEAIADKAKLEAKLIARNKYNQEILVSVMNDSGIEEKDLPPYLSEDPSPTKDKAVSMLGELKANACGVYKWFQDSFFW
ncbi:armadillo repeat-containing protein 1 [Anabrus simplex]|uniref:armadillo repeat-containing protein 1 n=1 Tax=Anabrus simplex TaxID=316456 RepID=UPI0034DD4D41